MRKYIEIAKVTFKSQLAWRFDIAFNMLFTIVKILFAYILWSVIFNDQNEVSGFTFHAMLSYYIISSFLSQLDMSSGVSGEVSNRIRGGTFSKYLVVPVNAQGYFLAQTFGASAFYLSFNLIAAVVWIFIFRIKFIFTSDIKLILMAVILCMLGLIFMMQLNFFLGIIAFKFENIWLFLMIKDNLVAFITGTMVPLVLLPQIVIQIMRYFPFYYITYLPSMLLIGRNSEEAIIGIILLAIWVLIFIPLNKVTYNKLRIKYDGVGI